MAVSSAGRLRHRIDFQRPVRTRNGGDLTLTWESVWTSVPAEIKPLNVRDFLASQAVQSEITAQIIIRHREGITADMRIKHGSTIYNIAGVMPDQKTGRDWLVIPVTTGVNDGD